MPRYDEQDVDAWLQDYQARVDQAGPNAQDDNRWIPMPINYGHGGIQLPCRNDNGEDVATQFEPEVFDERLFVRYVGVQREGTILDKFFGPERSYAQGRIFAPDDFIFVFRLRHENGRWIPHNNGFWLGPLTPANVEFVAVLYNSSNYLDTPENEERFDVAIQGLYDALNTDRPVHSRVPFIPYYLDAESESIRPLFSWC